MQLENTFTVPVPVQEAWRVLLDVQQIAPCMPGATVDSVEGDDVIGRVRVKLGPIALTYRGTVKFVERDEAAHRVVLSASARETRGSGTASATITAVLHERDGQTTVTVATDLNVTGKPAQFGRGVMADVSENLIRQFATSLAREIEARDASKEAAPSTAPSTAHSAPSAAHLPPATRPSAEAIDLLGTAGAPLVKRAAPVLAGLALVGLLGWLIARALR